jgi:xanthine dehydrogenase accessory factor
VSDLRTLVTSARRLRVGGASFGVATVISVSGTSPYRQGDRFIVSTERWLAGRGGRLDDDLLQVMRFHARGEAVLARYDASNPDVRLAFGLAPDGAIDVFHEPGSAARTDPLVFGDRCLVAQRRGALATVYRSTDNAVPVGTRAALLDGALETTVTGSAVVAQLGELCREALSTISSLERFVSTSGGDIDVFVEVVDPPPRLFVFGAGCDAVPLVDLGHTLGWEVFVCVPHARPHVRDRFANADDVLVTTLDDAIRCVMQSAWPLAIVMSHDYDEDKRALGLLLRTNAAYIALRGSRGRASTMLAEIGHSRDDERLHAPPGISIGARTPSELALAIVAEAQSSLGRAHRSGRFFSGTARVAPLSLEPEPQKQPA